MHGQDSTLLCLPMDKQGLENLGQLLVMAQTKVNEKNMHVNGYFLADDNGNTWRV